MPQEKRRSISCGSFLTCDDPRGVVECQAIRKSNVISPQKRELASKKIEPERNQQKRNKTLAVLIEEEKNEGITVEVEITSELQKPVPSLELNKVVNSCSNVKKHFSRGSFDLQQSLALLNGLKKPRLMGFEDEMKNVVRSSLLRQFVITNPVFEHNFGQKKQLGSPDMPSSSSSQSSLVYSTNLASSEFSSISSSSSSLRTVRKGSSLIVKLMGLESFPSSTKKHKGSEKRLKILKPMDDIVYPMASEALFGAQELSLKQRSTHEVLEALKIKGLVKKPLSSPELDMKKPIMPKLEEDMKRVSSNSSQNNVKKSVCSKTKASAKLNKRTQKKQEAVKKVSEIVKVNPSARKGEEKKVSQSSDELRSQDPGKLTRSRRTTKTKDGILISKNQNSCQQKTASDTNLDKKTQKTYRNCQLVWIGRNHRTKGESKAVQAVCEKVVNEPAQITECGIEVQSSLSAPPEDLSMNTNREGQGHDPIDKQSSQFDGNHSIMPEGSDSQTSRKSLIHKSKLKALILNDPSFVCRAEELFDLQRKPISAVPLSIENDHNVADTKLLQDCANEVLELRSLRFSQACLPFPRSYKAHARNALFLDRLLEEICNGIESFKGYLSPTSDMLFSDTLHLIIDHDLKFKSGTWEIGWRNAFSQDEVEQVISELDRLILGKLIEEILVDFML